MLRLRCSILAQILSSHSASPSPQLWRLISAATPAISPSPSFAVEEYLVQTCGLTRAQALKASAKLSHLKSPSKPDAVLAFLADLGLSSADVASVVAKDPRFLCTGVDRTLVPVVSGLTNLGLPRPKIARLVSLVGRFFRNKSVVPKLEYYLHLFGSSDNLLRALKRSSYFFSYDLERIIKPTVVLLRECGLDDCHIAKLCTDKPGLLITNHERVLEMVACADGLGVPRGSGMFWRALKAAASIRQENMAAKVDCLKNTFRWSDAEVGIAVSNAPQLLPSSKESLQRKSEFLISELGLEPSYLAHRSMLLTYSVEGRMRPRYYVVKFLRENGLLKRNPGYNTVFNITEKIFMGRFICPHTEAAPYLAEDYAAACREEMPARFIFT
ncbi:transcription termination factor MTERF8, chloroplastic-like [Aegilops tauschii subsp. strangulata]|nr:uncharacterized protein LOC109768387 [Aegilops tauschii subsp. strangulata]